MTFEQLQALLTQNAQGVVLLEGRRTIPSGDALKATAIASQLARDFPHLRFRSGNAEGADQAFAAGVAAIDPRRLQIVAPYESHRKSVRYAEAVYDSPESLLTVQEEVVAYKTLTATPKNKRLITKRNEGGPLGAKAAYLMRDTMKVVGYSAAFPKPLLALLYVAPEDPEAGGTGHTLRVCRQEGVPYVFQDTWQT